MGPALAVGEVFQVQKTDWDSCLGAVHAHQWLFHKEYEGDGCPVKSVRAVFMSTAPAKWCQVSWVSSTQYDDTVFCLASWGS